jgi:protein-disulfide isomerase
LKDALPYHGRLSYWVFTGATIVAVVFAAALIFIGRMGYAKADFTLLPPNAQTPDISQQANPGTSIGSPQAPVTIVVYSDFFCGLCQRFALTTEKELEKVYIETGQVRLVYKTIIVHGDQSILVSEAAECAAEQNKFWPYHDLLMQTQLSPSAENVTIETLEVMAGQVGLDMASFDTSLRSEKYREKVLSDDAEGKRLGVNGAPTFFVNRMKGLSYMPFETFQKVINELTVKSAD